MIRSFKHKGLRALFEKGDSSGVYRGHIDRLHVILTRLNISRTPHDMRLPGLRLHKLKGNLKDHYAVFVSGNWRVVFTFQNQDATEVDYLDYH